MSAERIGLALAQDVVRLIVVRDGRVVRALEAARRPEDTVLDALETLLGAEQPRLLRRAGLGVAFGLTLSHVKHLTGLPPVQDPEVLAAIVREGRQGFFVGEAADLCTTGVVATGATSAWAGALSEPLVQQVRVAAGSLGIKLVAVAPVGVALPLALPGPSLRWVDGGLSLELEAQEEGESRVRCHLADPEADASPPAPPPELASYGEEGGRFADALGAARLTGREALSVGPDGTPFSASRVARRRIVPPLLLAGAALVAFGLSPLRHQLDARRGEALLEDLHASPEWELATDAYGQLARATAILTEVEEFRSSRMLVTPILGELAFRLPAGTVVERVGLEGHEVTLAAHTPEDAVRLAAALRASPAVAGVEIMGRRRAVSVAGQDLDAVTLRLALHTVADSTVRGVR